MHNIPPDKPAHRRGITLIVILALAAMVYLAGNYSSALPDPLEQSLILAGAPVQKSDTASQPGLTAITGPALAGLAAFGLVYAGRIRRKNRHES